MTTKSQDARKSVIAAYEGARRNQAAEHDPLPSWHSLPIEMREAIIHVYFQGRKDAIAKPAT